MTNSSKYYQGERSEVLTFMPDTYSKILEVGCGEGDFRVNFNNGCEYWGIEPSIDAANIAQNKLNKVLVGTYQGVSSELPDEYFDIVICNDVIEHMTDHDEFLQSIKKHMCNDACLVGSIPNVRYFWNLVNLLVKKDWKYIDTGILDRTHLRFFTHKSLKRTFIMNDFMIEKIAGINSNWLADMRKESIIKWVICIFVIKLLGPDLKFVQFGFCARPKNQV